MANLFDRVGVASATVGAGTVTLGATLGAIVPNLCGFQSLAAAGVIDQNVVSYLILDSNGNWEYGWGIYTLSSTTLTRNVSRSSAGTTAIALSGNEQVFLTARSEDLATIDALASNNMAINAAMDVSQENGQNATALASGGAAKYVVDGYTEFFQSAAAVMQGFQAPVTAVVQGLNFKNCLTFKATTGNGGTVAATDSACIMASIEGYRFAKAYFGNANAQPITIGFWVISTVTGTFALSVRNFGTNRSYVVDITVTAANTWQWVSVVIPGDTGITWLTTTGVGAFITWTFVPRTSQQVAANTWVASNGTATPATTNFFSANNNSVSITGVVILPGAHQLSSEQSANLTRSFDVELQQCLRYYEKSYAYASIPGSVTSVGEVLFLLFGPLPNVAYEPGSSISFAVRKRIPPVMTGFSVTTGASGFFRDAFNGADVAVAFFNIGDGSFAWDATMSAAGTNINMQGQWVADSRL